MGPHAFAICWLAGLRYQDLVRETAPGRPTASTKPKAWRPPLTAFLAIVALVALTLAAPAAQVQEQSIAAAPADPSQDEIRGYGAVEASRVAIGEDTQASGHEVSAANDPSWDEPSGYGSVEASRAGR